jgi:hypothetical protein
MLWLAKGIINSVKMNLIKAIESNYDLLGYRVNNLNVNDDNEEYIHEQEKN